MVNIDALLSEWAYRCKKGYPDLDSPSDLRVLNTILKEQGISLPLSEDLAAAEQALDTTEIDTKKEFFELLDQIDLSKQDIQKVSTMVIQFNDDTQLDEDDVSNKIVDSKNDLKDQIDLSDLNANELAELSARLLGFKYKEEIKNYFLKKGGKAMVQDQVFEVLFDSMV